MPNGHAHHPTSPARLRDDPIPRSDPETPHNPDQDRRTFPNGSGDVLSKAPDSREKPSSDAAGAQAIDLVEQIDRSIRAAIDPDVSESESEQATNRAWSDGIGLIVSNERGVVLHNEPPVPESEAERLAALREAKKRSRKIRSACRVATFNGTTSTICAGFSLLLAPVSPSALLAAVALGFVAWNEFRGRRALSRLQIEAPMQLARNQMLFATLLVLYGCWGLYGAFTTPPVSVSYAQYGAEISELMKPFDGVYRAASIAMYLGVALFGILFQGNTAWYYASRRKYLARYLNETPEWIIRMQQHGHGL